MLSIIKLEKDSIGIDLFLFSIGFAMSRRWFHQGTAQLVSVARATAQAELRLSGLKALFDSLGA